jgi:hypothetical protein
VAVPWQFGFHVSDTATFQARYDEVLAAHPVPAAMVADVAAAHDLAVAMIANHSVVPPMDVMFNGWWDADNIQSGVKVEVKQA